MEELLKRIAGYVALALEGAAVLLIAIGAVMAAYRALRSINASISLKRELWMHFAAWLVLGLEFELAADIIRTAIAPGWQEIGQLGAIAVIRTFLNYFLERDMEHEQRSPGESSEGIRRAA